MGSEWRTLILGKHCSKIGSGATPRGGSKVYLSEGDVCLIRSQNIYNSGFAREGLVYISAEHAEQLKNVEVLQDDVLLNITGDSVARCCQVVNDVLPARVNQHVAIIRPAPDVLDPRFLRYFLISPAMQAQMLSWASAGGTRNALTKGMIESFEIYAPVDVSEQRAIAHILGTLDDKIELNRRMNATLEAMARALFKSWFVDFDPMWENIKRHGPGHPLADQAAARPGAPSLPAEILALFPDGFEDSALGLIPRGWRVGRLNEIAKNYRRSVSPEEMPSTTPYIGLQHMPRRSIALDTWGTADEVGSGKFQFRQGEILFGKLRPYFHKVGIAPLDGVCSTDILVIAPKTDEWYSYILEVVSAKTFVDYTEAHSSGTRMPRTSWKDMGRFSLPLPSSELAEVYHRSVLPLFQRIQANIHESRTLASLRDTLLPRLISGELRVGDAERFLAEVGV